MDQTCYTPATKTKNKQEKTFQKTFGDNNKKKKYIKNFNLV